MKIDQIIETKFKSRTGKILSIEHFEGFLPEVLVLLDTGEEMIFYEEELEAVDVWSKQKTN